MSSAPAPAISLAMLEAWFGIGPDGLLAVDPDGRIVLANRQAEAIFGYERDALRDRSVEDLLPESLREAHRIHRRDYTGNRSAHAMGAATELTGLRRDGRQFPVEIGLNSITTERGAIIVASIRDISETRRVQRALARARHDQFMAQIGRLTLESPDYEPAVRQIPQLVSAALDVPVVAILSTEWHRSELHVRASIGLSVHDADALTSIFNRGGLVAHAYGADTRTAVTMEALVEGALAPIGAELAAAGFRDAAMVPLFGRFGVEPLGLLIALAPAPAGFDEDKVAFLQSVANLLAAAVRRKRTEEQLAHAQRLDAIGQLTGGIAHDFNNLLTVISGNLQLLEVELSGRPGVEETVASALHAVDRGSDLTRRLLAFARRQPLQPRAVVPKPLLDELGDMLRRTLGEAIAVGIECPVEVPDVYADASELDAALVNLALNARDAMSRGGQLAITVRELSVDADDNRWKVPPGSYVAFTVSDSGTGMSPEVQAHALEPFFTTKDGSKGSGLGLSMVYGFATQSGGGIAIDSRLGYGTRVELLLPVANAAVATAVAPRVSDGLADRSDWTILVVEDDAEVRTLVARFLGAIGYRVVTAAGAHAALAELQARPDVDLLFSDVVLGDGLDGVELAQAARRLRPSLAVLLTSGYPRTQHASDDTASGFALLRKPWRREQLTDAVRRALERA